MGSAEDVEVIRRGFAAFSAGDMATLNELFTEDAVWQVLHCQGRSRAGTGSCPSSAS